MSSAKRNILENLTSKGRSIINTKDNIGSLNSNQIKSKSWGLKGFLEALLRGWVACLITFGQF